MNFTRILAALATSAAVLLAACGGGGSSDGGIGGTGGGGGGGGIGGTGVAYGTITGFGSVWVNGVRYESSTTVFKRDDDNASQSDLRVGMVARVEGSSTTATTITVDSALKGRVELVSGDRYIVMGQTVQTDAQTAFENSIRPVAGDYVEVHGLPVQAGVIAATYIERKSTLATPPYIVTGFVAAQDSSASTVTVGTLTVQYAGAERGDMPAGSWVGQLVEIKGTACAGTPVCGTLTASKIEPSGPRIATSARAEVEGYVSSLTTDGFVLGGQRVVVTPGTVFEDGVAADLIVGTKVEVEGSITDGVMTATKIEFRDSVRIEGDVLAVVGDRVTIVGLAGVEVQVTSLTELKDLASLASLQAGEHVRLRGRVGNGNLVVASELEVRSSDSDVELRAPVSAFADPQLTLLGVTVDTTGRSDSAFQDDSVSIGRTAFFAALSVGRVVKVQGVRVGNTVTWQEFELED
jgi:hypothetical protein